MKVLKEIKRESYGHDERAINRHSERWYENDKGQIYVLSRTLDGCPPFFEAYGPFKESHQGLLPRLLVKDKEYWGGDWTWKQAVKALCAEIGAWVMKGDGSHV